jgi:hypothetical protein
MYQILRRLLFILPAETAHYLSMNVLKGLCAIPFIRKQIRSTFTHQSPLTTHLFGLSFKILLALVPASTRMQNTCVS